MPRSTPAPVSFEGTKFEGKTVQQVQNSLYGQALQSLRNEHEDEFFDIVEALYSAHGLTYKRRLTEAQKAEQQVRALLSAHPELATKFATEVIGAIEAAAEAESA